jgi:small-conductance mechanosensitive channel
MKRLLKPVVLLLLACAAAYAVLWALGVEYDPRDPAKGPLHPWLALGSAALLALFVTWMGASVVQITLWHPLESKYRRPIPRLLKILATVAIAVLAVAAITELLYQRSVTTLWAASGFAGLGLVLGLKDMLRDVFSGVLLNLEQPFRINDQIQILGGGLDSLEGEVVEIDWRSTHLRTAQGDLVVVPNSIVGAAALVNKRKDARPERCEVSFHLGPETAVDWARTVLLKGIKASRSALEHPSPAAVVTAVHNWGIEYSVHFCFDSARVTLAMARDDAITTVLAQIQQHGLKLATQQHQVLMRQEVAPARRT